MTCTPLKYTYTNCLYYTIEPHNAIVMLFRLTNVIISSVN